MPSLPRESGLCTAGSETKHRFARDLLNLTLGARGSADALHPLALDLPSRAASTPIHPASATAASGVDPSVAHPYRQVVAFYVGRVVNGVLSLASLGKRVSRFFAEYLLGGFAVRLEFIRRDSRPLLQSIRHVSKESNGRSGIPVL